MKRMDLVSRIVRPSRHRRLAQAMLISGAAILTGLAFSQNAGPTDSKGLTAKALGHIDLSTEIEGLAGRQLRGRLITIEPGGRAGWHSHKDRPTLEYVLQGNIVEIRNGVEVPHAAGDMVLATHEVSHWWENRGTVPVVLLPVDIFKP
jgi:quercetin dioxygenase-like cupin family protein